MQQTLNTLSRLNKRACATHSDIIYRPLLIRSPVKKSVNKWASLVTNYNLSLKGQAHQIFISTNQIFNHTFTAREYAERVRNAASVTYWTTSDTFSLKDTLLNTIEPHAIQVAGFSISYPSLQPRFPLITLNPAEWKPCWITALKFQNFMLGELDSATSMSLSFQQRVTDDATKKKEVSS